MASSTLASLFEGGVFAALPRRRWEWTRGAENSLGLAYARQLPPRRAPRAYGKQHPCLPQRGRCLRGSAAQTVGADKGRRELPQSRLRSTAPFVRAPRAVTEDAEGLWQAAPLPPSKREVSARLCRADGGSGQRAPRNKKGTPAQPHGGEFAKLVFSCVSGRVPPRIRRCHAVDGAPLACKRSDATGCIISQACRFPFNKGATGLHAIALRSSGHVLRVPEWVWRGRGDFSTPRCVCGLRPMQQAYDAANDQKSIISPPLGWNCTLV